MARTGVTDSPPSCTERLRGSYGAISYAGFGETTGMEVVPPLGYLLVLLGLVAYLFPGATIGVILLGTVSGSVLARLGRPVLKGAGLVLAVEGGFLVALGEPVLIDYYLGGGPAPFEGDRLVTELIDRVRSFVRAMTGSVGTS